MISSGRIDHPPERSALASLPSDFGPRAIVFVDTEEEFDWAGPRGPQHTSTSAIRYLPEFQRLMEAHGYRPCYLIDYPVAANAQSADVIAGLKAGDRCDIGTHLHPWVNPAFGEDFTAVNSFAGNLPAELERAKLIELTERIAKLCGSRPTVYRAGRYGVGPNSAQILEEAGYRLDTSVRPFFDYRTEGGPDFSLHRNEPFWAGPSGSLLELPLSVGFLGPLRRAGGLLQRKFGVWAGRTRLAKRIPLTPEDMPFDDVRRVVQAMLDDGEKLLSFSFHSPSLAPGHTPYVRTSAQLSDFYRWWDKMLALLEGEGVTPASVDDILNAAWSQRPT